MDTKESSAYGDAHPPTEDHDDTVEVHYSGLERLDRPHACLNGYVYIGHMVEGEDGEETEVIAVLSCRRCADSR